MGNSAPSVAPDVAALLRFSAADLAENRAGRLSANQLHTATHAATRNAILLLLFVGVVLVLVLVVRPRGAGRVYYSVLSLGGLAIFGVIAWQTVSARARARVAMLEGPIEIEGGVRLSSILVIAKHRFPISIEAGRRIQHTGPYRVYYLPGSDQLLSLELLGPPPTAAPESP